MTWPFSSGHWGAGRSWLPCSRALGGRASTFLHCVWVLSPKPGAHIPEGPGGGCAGRGTMFLGRGR